MASKYNLFNYETYIKLKNPEQNEASFYFFGTVNLSRQGLKKVLLGYHSLGNSSWELQFTEVQCVNAYGENVFISRPIESMDGAVSVCWVNVGAVDTQ